MPIAIRIPKICSPSRPSQKIMPTPAMASTAAAQAARPGLSPVIQGLSNPVKMNRRNGIHSQIRPLGFESAGNAGAELAGGGQCLERGVKAILQANRIQAVGKAAGVINSFIDHGGDASVPGHARRLGDAPDVTAGARRGAGGRRMTKTPETRRDHASPVPKGPYAICTNCIMDVHSSPASLPTSRVRVIQ